MTEWIVAVKEVQNNGRSSNLSDGLSCVKILGIVLYGSKYSILV